MRINVRGSTKYRRQLVRKAIRFCLGEMFTKRQQNGMTINVSFINCKGFYGDAYHEGNKYTIRIKNMQSLVAQLRTVMHEMVHVQQFKVKRLKVSSQYLKWEGQDYQEPDNDDYYFLPWEILAQGLERGLLCKFLRQEKLLKKYLNKKEKLALHL